MKSLILVLALILATPATRPSEFDTKIPAALSVMQIIAAPEKYDGRVVGTVGYLALRDDHGILYLHREDYDFGLYVNGLNIQFEPKLTGEDEARFNLHYVYLSGKFEQRTMELDHEGRINKRTTWRWSTRNASPTR